MEVESECQICNTFQNEESKLREIIDEKDLIIKMLQDKNDNLVKKNVLSAKEIKNANLAVAECLFQKNESLKELNSLRETMNEILKKNVTLNDEVFVKNELISN